MVFVGWGTERGTRHGHIHPARVVDTLDKLCRGGNDDDDIGNDGDWGGDEQGCMQVGSAGCAAGFEFGG